MRYKNSYMNLNSKQTGIPQFNWIPRTSGTYTTTFFFWESVDNSAAVALPITFSFQVYN
jgi:hypothetical protein